jgi:hypothetical protein
LKKAEALGKSCFLVLESVVRVCITRADDSDAKLASRVSYASCDVGIIITVPITPSEREETIAKRIN